MLRTYKNVLRRPSHRDELEDHSLVLEKDQRASLPNSASGPALGFE
jgi:hypothetical protein